MSYSSLTYHETQAEANAAETKFWNTIANPVNQPSSDVAQVIYRDNAPLYTREWADCWICHVRHYGSD
jgi:hypothetical protein